MKAPTCPQTWKAEALRDGRMAGAEAVQFHRHAEACAICAQSSRRLDDLAALLAELPVPARDPLTVRRDRQRLLEGADAAATGRGQRSIGSRVAFACAIVAAAAAIGLIARRSLRRPDVAATAPAISSATIAQATSPPEAPNVEAPLATSSTAADPVNRPLSFSATVSHDAGARWSRHEDQRHVRIRLDEGTLSLVVTHGEGDKHVTFKVPDGEIEDLGTSFTVSVEGGSTRKVVVSEGSIAVRLRGQAPVHLGSGESWERSAPVGRSARAGHVRAGPRAESSSDRTSDETTHATEASTDAPRAPAKSECAENGRWDDAMADFQAGRYAAAADRFGTFAVGCAGDRRAEDATYLRVVALARAGRQDAARAAAQSYLTKFPNGFRRRECERFLKSGPSVSTP